MKHTTNTTAASDSLPRRPCEGVCCNPVIVDYLLNAWQFTAVTR